MKRRGLLQRALIRMQTFRKLRSAMGSAEGCWAPGVGSPVALGAEAFARVELKNASDGGAMMVKGAAAPVSSDSQIEIKIGGATVHVPAGADAETLRNVFAALRFTR